MLCSPTVWSHTRRPPEGSAQDALPAQGSQHEVRRDRGARRVEMHAVALAHPNRPAADLDRVAIAPTRREDLTEVDDAHVVFEAARRMAQRGVHRREDLAKDAAARSG